MKTVPLALGAALALAGCVIDDADPPGAITGLTLAPSSAAIDVFRVRVTGDAAVAYRSDLPAVLELGVDGAVVAQDTLSFVDSLTTPIDVTIPLGEGPNEIVGTLRYAGEEVTRRFTVTAAMTPPAITLPAWTTTYTPHVGMAVTGSITVAAAPAYDVTRVDVSVDGGPWLPATAGAAGWDAAFADPDLGDSDVAVRATTAVDGHTAETIARGVLHVDPVFACAAPSMLPDTRLVRNVGTEVRTMVGYFGHPDAGHTVSFLVTASSPNTPGNPRLTIGSQTNAYGTTAIVAAFGIGAFSCDTGQASCDMPYDLTPVIDGVALPVCAGFGVIRRYN